MLWTFICPLIWAGAPGWASDHLFLLISDSTSMKPLLCVTYRIRYRDYSKGLMSTLCEHTHLKNARLHCSHLESSIPSSLKFFNLRFSYRWLGALEERGTSGMPKCRTMIIIKLLCVFLNCSSVLYTEGGSY